MLTGFYNISKLDTPTLKEFFKEAVLLSYQSYVHVLDTNVAMHRIAALDKTIGQMIDNADSNHHNVCIDRSIQYGPNNYGEIGYTIIEGSPSYYLFIEISLENLNFLVQKYDLTMN